MLRVALNIIHNFITCQNDVQTDSIILETAGTKPLWRAFKMESISMKSGKVCISRMNG